MDEMERSFVIKYFACILTHMHYIQMFQEHARINAHRCSVHSRIERVSNKLVGSLALSLSQTHTLTEGDLNKHIFVSLRSSV